MARYHKVRDLCADVVFSILGPIANNVYVVDDGEGVIVVDPSCRPDAIMDMVNGRKVDAIFVTHRHEDHIGALADIHRLTGAKVYAPALEAKVIEAGVESAFGLSSAACPVDVRYKDGDRITVGKTTWEVLHTPGHTEGSRVAAASTCAQKMLRSMAPPSCFPAIRCSAAASDARILRAVA